MHCRKREQHVQRQEVGTEHRAGTGSACGRAREVVRLGEVGRGRQVSDAMLGSVDFVLR